ncbi:MAG TPA: hypothetical protein PKE26_03980 [Kiritimatiellia bacterium]|nr:hypothetical protein [Kiritimatiellia bacterium]HMO98248.1 hypothetical protein [Kiritimatiellia bacterium]HMP96593.1 hypothetical protein [Kiritimatiellia bacterium]
MIAKVDAKKRIVLPSARSGDVYEIQRHGDKGYELIRLERPSRPVRLSKKACERAMVAAPLSPKMSWEQLRALTRDA